MKVKTASLIAAIGCCALVVLSVFFLISRFKSLIRFSEFDWEHAMLLIYPLLEVVGFALLSVFFFTLYKKIDYEK
jgi:hypothetical protein